MGTIKKAPDTTDALNLYKKKLFLSALVSLIELIDTTCTVKNLDFTSEERVRCVGDLDLYQWIFNAFDCESLF